MTVLLPDPASEDCRALSSILARVGDKWTVLIVVLLGDGPKRFNEIKRLVGGISQRMLTFTLRGLERDGLVKRTVFPTTPQRVDYELTKLGGTLWQAVEPLGLWARAHLSEIMTSRDYNQHYDPDRYRALLATTIGELDEILRIFPRCCGSHA
ncbi:MAG TPA: helix-turn-helix domain-containing protein [Gemmatimonadales bacterium]|nr:helix-turn-helix domain-containing protein [Gemmatimonadales bacterium]